MWRLFLLSFLLPYSQMAWSYAQFLASGEVSCVHCHFNAFGSSQLTDYGRSTFALDTSAQHFGMKNVARELVAQKSSFLGTHWPQWFRPHAKYRGQRYTQSAWKRDAYNRATTTQAQAGLTLRVGKGDNLTLSYTAGYRPDAQSDEERRRDQSSAFESSEYFLSLSPHSALRLYAGLMDKVFGLRIPETNTYGRSRLGLGAHEQGHQLALWTSFSFVEAGLTWFAGNLQREVEYHQQGGTLLLELTPWAHFRPGFSFMSYTTNTKVEQALALHSRLGFKEGGSVLAEVGLGDHRLVDNSTLPRMSHYQFFQGSMPLLQGLNFLNTIEFFKDNVLGGSPQVFRFGPGLQYFFLGHGEIRAELINERTYPKDGVQRDRWDLLAQLNFWL